MKRSELTTVAAIVAIVATAAVLAWERAPAPNAPAASTIGGAFHLTNDRGVPVDARILKGKWSAVYFGYTFCPDVCPTTLAALAQAATDLGDRAKTFQVIFITVDPRRDTPSQLRNYLASPSFPKMTIGLTGSAAQIRNVADAYHVYFSRNGAGPNYSVDHTSIVYLMNPDGEFVRPIKSGPPAAMAAQISSAMAER